MKADPKETKSPNRGQRTLQGVVISDKMQKTRIIEMKSLSRHALYQKTLVHKTRIFVHDEKNESKKGDIVLVAATRPLSHHKNFRLLKILVQQAAQ